MWQSRTMKQVKTQTHHRSRCARVALHVRLPYVMLPPLQAPTCPFGAEANGCPSSVTWVVPAPRALLACSYSALPMPWDRAAQGPVAWEYAWVESVCMGCARLEEMCPRAAGGGARRRWPECSGVGAGFLCGGHCNVNAVCLSAAATLFWAPPQVPGRPPPAVARRSTALFCARSGTRRAPTASCTMPRGRCNSRCT